MKIKLTILSLIPVLLFSSTLSRSDDTEIYLNNSSIVAGAPLVMLALDYRSNLASRVCQGYNGTYNSECGGFFKVEIKDADGNGTGNYVDRLPDVPLDDGDVSFLELLIAALDVTFDALLDQFGEGAFKLGLMLNHQDTTTGQCGDGPVTASLENSSFASAQDYSYTSNDGFTSVNKVASSPVRYGIYQANSGGSNANSGGGNSGGGNSGGGSSGGGSTSAKCSNGGYMYLGFKSFTEEYKRAYIGKLLEMNRADLIDANASNHPYQGAELYFELFRYLTGQNVYNGHKAFDDFNSSDNDMNLGYTLGYIPASTTIIPPVEPSNPLDFTDPTIGWDATIETAYVPSSSTTGSYSYSDTDTYQYISPITEQCSRVYVINVMFQVSQQENNSDDAIETVNVTSGTDGGLKTSDSDSFSVSSSNAFVDVLRRMNEAYFDDGTWGTVTTDYGGTANVTSYFFVDSTKVNNTTRGYAAAGGGTVTALSDDPDELVEDFTNAFSSILSISTTFVSATVPVNVFNRSESLDNVFFGIFEAEETPQWPGNVKRFRLRTNNGLLQVVDANCPENPATPTCDEAIAADGRIEHSALSFWTDETSFDVDEELGTIATRPYNGYDSDLGEVGSADGRSVDRGAAGQRISGFTDDAPSDENSDGKRIIYYDPSVIASGGSLLNALDADATTAEALWDSELCTIITGNDPCTTTWADAATQDSGSDTVSSNDQEAAINLLKFGRGIDVYDRDGDGSFTDSRPWLFADILHAQPAPVNFGATGSGYDADNPELYIATAGNDGFVRLIRNSTAAGDHIGAGNEIWAFMPQELLPILEDLSEDSALVDHPYGVDGALTVYTTGNETDGTIKSSDGDKAILFFGLRRGGKSYYALDISDPSNPKILWRITKTTGGGDFDELGQSWSRPRVRQVTYKDASDNDVTKTALIFAGGYDTLKDDNEVLGPTENYNDTDNNGTADASYDSEGNAIFIVDAFTGDLIWKAVKGNSTGNVSDTVYNHANLDDSIPSDVSPIDTDTDGYVDRAYVGDTGGVVWRVDLAGSRNLWKITPVLSVGRHATSGCSDVDGNDIDCPDRRFFHRPDIVPAVDEFNNNANYHAVLLGSGNRPFPRQIHPDDANGDPQYDQFYALKDSNTTSGTPPANITYAKDMADVTATTQESIDSACDAGGTGSDACNELDDLVANGWFFSLINDDGEKLLASSITFFGQTFFSSYVPSGGQSGTCAPPEGTAYTYVINLADGSPAYGFIGDTIAQQRSTSTGSGIPSDPVLISLDGNIYITPGNIPRTEQFRRNISGNPLRKTYWFESTE